MTSPDRTSATALSTVEVLSSALFVGVSLFRRSRLDPLSHDRLDLFRRASLLRSPAIGSPRVPVSTRDEATISPQLHRPSALVRLKQYANGFDVTRAHKTERQINRRKKRAASPDRPRAIPKTIAVRAVRSVRTSPCTAPPITASENTLFASTYPPMSH